MSDAGKFSLIKPTIDTPFHIDFEWWKSHDHNWRVYLFGFLCQQHQQAFENREEIQWIDWIDQETAEITQVDGLQHILMTHCALQPGFMDDNATLVNAVFRILLSTGNKPTSPKELGNLIGKNPLMILRTLSGPRVYQGIRPIASL
jgi:hypothetical protein